MNTNVHDYEQEPPEGGMTWDEEQQLRPKQQSYTTPASPQTADTTTASSDTHSTSKEVADVDDSQEAGSDHSLEEGEVADEDSKATSAGTAKDRRATEGSSSRAGSPRRCRRPRSRYAFSRYAHSSCPYRVPVV
ncbi:hypothetical protein I350_08391 [Cryptococcus amylolentus CBS 6273]|uniref:Uncharacterized protein n=1 Tax=Cryptococcus amylolentus CBS 6273 TaxID=1296118 RepID=A0A1E3J4A0_9TREE|nr:hypothetical protein I350_08391 [Cryptococcus amylolentus CBS 6273]